MAHQRSLLGYAVPAALAPMRREERAAAEKAWAVRQQAAAFSLGLPWPAPRKLGRGAPSTQANPNNSERKQRKS